MRKETPVEGGDGKEFLFRHQTNQIVHGNKKNTAGYTPPLAGYTPPMAGVILKHVNAPMATFTTL